MRNRIILGGILAAVLGATFHSQAPATSQPPSQDNQTSLQVVDVVLVPLLVSVTDNKGKLVANLKQQDFRVYEDDKLQTVNRFDSETDLPLSIALLVDASGSIVSKLKFEQAAATDFFFNTIKRRKDRATVISFNSVARILSDDAPDGFADEPEKLADAVNKIRAEGGTAVFDAIFLAASRKLAFEKGDRRRLIILISDGDDTESRYSINEALEASQRHDTTIYAISTNKTSATRERTQEEGDKNIQKLVDETGGRAYFPTKIDDLATEFQKIGDELRSQYVLSYTPSNSKLDGTYRKIRVEMVDKKYKARTRAGYFALDSD